MSHTPSWRLALASLIIYIIILPPAIGVFVLHIVRTKSQSSPSTPSLAKRTILATLGFGYTLLFITLQLIAAGISLSSNDPDKLQTASTLMAVGLSPLLLGTQGILHEANHKIHSSKKRSPWFSNIWIIIAYHIATYAVIGILASSTGSSDADPLSALHSTKFKVGIILLVVLFFILADFIALSLLLLLPNNRREAEAHTGWTRGPKALVLTTLAILPLIGIRLLYSILECFVTDTTTFNPETGSIAARAALEVAPPMLTAILMTVGGLLAIRGWNSSSYGGAVSAEEVTTQTESLSKKPGA